MSLMVNPAKHTDLPVDERGFPPVRADLRTGTATAPVPDAWSAVDKDFAALQAGDRDRIAPIAHRAGSTVPVNALEPGLHQARNRARRQVHTAATLPSACLSGQIIRL
jgi:hypothetical protein